MTDFEAWMQTMTGYFRNFEAGHLWHRYREEFGVWPTPEMKARGRQMREEYLRGLGMAKGK